MSRFTHFIRKVLRGKPCCPESFCFFSFGEILSILVWSNHFWGITPESNPKSVEWGCLESSARAKWPSGGFTLRWVDAKRGSQLPIASSLLLPTATGESSNAENMWKGDKLKYSQRTILHIWEELSQFFDSLASACGPPKPWWKPSTYIKSFSFLKAGKKDSVMVLVGKKTKPQSTL